MSAQEPTTPQKPRRAPRHPRRLQCTATAKRTGKQCGGSAIPGRAVCDKHGGLAPSLHGTKDGLHSKLPSRLAEAYQRALADPTLLDQGRSIALMEALTEEMAERLRSGDTPELRREASGLARGALNALDAADPAGSRKTLESLAKLLEEGTEGDAAREKLFTMADRLGSRRDSAWSTKLQRIQVVNANDIALMLGMLLQRARSKWGEAQARELAEMFEGLLDARAMPAGRGESALAAIPIEGHTVNGEANAQIQKT